MLQFHDKESEKEIFFATRSHKLKVRRGEKNLGENRHWVQNFASYHPSHIGTI